MNKITHPGQLVQFFGLPYIITAIETDYDPYLEYCKHFRAVCPVTGREHGGALTDYPNPHTDINGVLNGTKSSKYV